MIQVGAYEAKTRLPKLLEKVAQGERVTITKHGVPVAMLVPVAPSQRIDHASIAKQLRLFRKGRQLEDLTVREMMEEGRRF